MKIVVPCRPQLDQTDQSIKAIILDKQILFWKSLLSLHKCCLEFSFLVDVI